MTAFIRDFLNDQSGAVTVDWTILAASVVGLGLATTAAVRTGVVALGSDIDGSLRGAEIAGILGTNDPHAGLNLESETGYRDMEFHFFTAAGVNNWYANNVRDLSDDALMAALETRRTFMETELAMGPDDAPSYGEPWGHTDMYNLTYWEAARRGLA